MKSFFTALKALFKGSRLGSTIRMSSIAVILVYIMLVSAILPTYEAYTALSAKTVETKETSLFTQEKDNSLEATSVEDEVSEQDNYKNTWDSNIAAAYVVKEEERLRSDYEKHFRMSDGSYTLMSFANEVHYLSGDKYEEIDNTLVKDGNKYKNKSNKLQVEIPESYSKGGKTYISVGNYELSFRMENHKFDKPNKIDNKALKQVLKAKENHLVNFKNESGIYFSSENNAIELEQLLIGTKFKENIIVNAPLPSYEFVFDLKTKGLNLRLDERGNILATAEDKVIMTIPKGFMFDAKNVYSGKVEYDLIKKPSGYTLKIIADSTFINSSERAFPITIDPTVTVSTEGNYYSAIRTANNGTVIYDPNIGLPVTKNNLGFIGFDLPKSITNATVISASLSFSAKLSAGTSSTLSIWENKLGFSENNPPHPIFMDGELPSGQYIKLYNNKFDDPNNKDLPEQQLIITNKSMSRYSVDITPTLKRCIDFEDKFFGFAFIGSNSNTVYIANEQYGTSSHRPVAEIRYRNIVGLENYWDYDQYSIGKNNIYINKYNDAMTVVYDDASISSKLPIQLQHVYLSQYKDTQYNVDGVFTNVNYGIGWKINYQQIIRYRDGGNYEYYDADGTMHYFYHSSTLTAKLGHEVAEDEDGLGLRLHYEAGKYRIEDNNKNKSYFDYHGRLYKIEDRNGNVTNVIYGNGAQETSAGIPIKEINDGKGNKLTLNYNSGGFLTSVAYKRADGITAATVNYTYDSNKNLTKITNDDGTFSEYQYNIQLINGKKASSLFQFNDESGSALKFVSDKTLADDTGLNTPYLSQTVIFDLVKTRSAYRSAGNDSWIHISDTVYCLGLTLTSTPEAGKTYVPFGSFDKFGEDLNQFSFIERIYKMFEYIPIYKEDCKPFFSNNFRQKSVYDSCGRLASSYIDESESFTSIDYSYENHASAGVNINNNKLKASATYNPSIINYVKNGSFENGTADWTDSFSLGGSIYKNSVVSSKYSAQGKNSLEMFVAQPIGNEYEVSQMVSYLPAGTYTLSGYIRIENALVPNVASADYGAFLRLGGYAKSEYVTSDVFTVNNGFKKVSVTYTFNSPINVWIDCVVKNCSGTVYFDGIQLAKNNFGEIDVYNNAINAGFENWTGDLPTDWSLWTDTGLTTSSLVKKTTGYEAFDGSYGVKIKGSEKGSINLYQHVPIPKSTQSTAYTLSLWVNNMGRIYRLNNSSFLAVNYRTFDENMSPLTGFVAVQDSLPFSLWHQLSATFIATPETRFVEINIQINVSTSELLIDNVSLVPSEVINLGYDSRGINTYFSDGQTNYAYNESGDKISVNKDGNEQYGIVKDSKGNVLTANDINRKVGTKYTYDAFGRTTSETFQSLYGNKKISSTVTYQSINNNLSESVTEVDSMGFKTINNYYTFSELLTKTVFNDGSYVEYIYSDNTSSATQGAFPKEVKYIKIINRLPNGSILSTVVYRYLTVSDALESSDYGRRHVGSLYSVTMNNGSVYSYSYDKWGNTVKVKLNGVAQITYDYREADNALMQKTLSNGYAEKYSYDRLGRLTELQTRRNASSSFETKYTYNYTVSGKESLLKDHLNGLKYAYQYDTNGRLVLVGETEIDSYGYNKFDEYIYDVYGDFIAKNTLEAKKDVFFLSNPIGVSLSGNITHSRTANTETVSINSVKRITYTYNTTDLKTSFILREDNTLLRNSSYPNGVTILYQRDQRGKLIGYDVYKINSTNVSPSFSYRITDKTNTYEYDQGSEDLWDIEWLKNNQPANNAFPVSKLPDVEYNGEKITNIMRVHHGSVYGSSFGSVSLVNPNALMKYTGMSKIGFWIRQEAVEVGATVVNIPRLKYTDGTESQPQQLKMNTNWQYFTIDVDLNKTPKALILPWYNGQWLNIGNLSIYGKKQIWDPEYAIENQVNATSAPVTRMPTQVYNGTQITDIIRFCQVSYFDTSYYTLVDPEILEEIGESLKISYWIRKENVGYLIGGIFLRYSDGSYSEIPQLADNNQWQYFSITSNPNKKVVGVQLEYYYGSWMELGNVVIESNSIGRNDDRLAGEKLINGAYTQYGYDELGRQAEVGIKVNPSSTSNIIKEIYSFMDGTDDNTSFTVTSKAITYGASNGITYNYTYCMDNPSLGAIKAERANPYNIWQIKEGTTVKVQYNYDSLGRLIREDNRYTNKTVTYEYDGNNNLTKKTEYPLNMGGAITTVGTVKNYSYGDTTFKDRLTSYNGSAITYDAFGNPLNYMGKTMSWYGRELESIVSGSINLQFKYDYNGIRLSKTYNGTKTSYRYEGSKLLSETKGTDTIWYLYNDLGIAGIELNGISYYYVRNLSGDVTKLIDTNGNVVVEYTYDSWGKVLSTTGNLSSTVGAKNPIRYRGYYYDTESNLYYLQSRYYDPETGRFISTDAVAENGNLYAYCQNDPINNYDPSGYLSAKLKKTIFWVGVSATILAAVALTIATCGAGTAVLVAGVGVTVGTAANVTAAALIGIAAVSTVILAADDIKLNKPSDGNQNVYVLRDKTTDKVVYVGRTKNPEKRKKSHEANIENITFEIIASNLSREQARGIEQVTMLACHTRNFIDNIDGLNKINGISPRNKKLGIYMSAAKSIGGYIFNQISNEYYNWIGD